MSADRSEYRTARDVFAIRLDDDTLVWDPRTEQLHRLNAAGTSVWEALQDWTVAPTIGGDATYVDRVYALRLVERRTRATGQPMSPGG